LSEVAGFIVIPDSVRMAGDARRTHYASRFSNQWCA